MVRWFWCRTCRVPKKYSAMFNSIFINNSRFPLFICTTLNSNWLFSLLCYNPTVFLIRFVSFCRPSTSPLRTRFLGVRDRCYVRFLPNIRRKDRRDIDDSLGLSAFTLRWYALYRRNFWKVLLSAATIEEWFSNSEIEIYWILRNWDTSMKNFSLNINYGPLYEL